MGLENLEIREAHRRRERREEDPDTLFTRIPYRKSAPINFAAKSWVNPRNVPMVFKSVPTMAEQFGVEYEEMAQNAFDRIGAGSRFETSNLQQERLDRLVLDVEQKYYAAGGDIDYKFWLQFDIDDLEKIGFERDLLNALYQGHQWSVAKEDYEFDQTMADEKAASILMGGIDGLTRDEAFADLDVIEKYNFKIGQEYQGLLDHSKEMQAAYILDKHPTLEGMLLGRGSYDDAVFTVAGVDDDTMGALLLESVTAQYTDELDEELHFVDRGGWNGWFQGGTRSDALLRGEDSSIQGHSMDVIQEGVFGVLMVAMQGGINGFTWMVNEGGGAAYNVAGWMQGAVLPGSDPIDSGTFDRKAAGFAQDYKRGHDWLFPDSNTTQQRRDAERQLMSQIGRTDREVMMGLALPMLTGEWDAMKASDAQTFQNFMAMAGGDEGMAFGFFAEEVAFHNQEDSVILPDGKPGTYNEYLLAQKDIYVREAESRLELLDDENYTMGNVLMDTLALWGEAVETAAMVATVAEKQLFETALPFMSGEGFADFFDEVQKHDTPSDALGLKGTLVGLSLDIIMPALVDPTTYIFGPAMARGGSGVMTKASANAAAKSPVNKVLYRQLHDGVRSDTPAIGVYAQLDAYGNTGTAAKHLDAAGGYNAVPINARTYLDHPEHSKTTRIIEAEAVVDLLDEISPTELRAARAKLKESGVDGAEVTYNPTTGRAKITEGNAEVLAQMADGRTSVPVRIKVDPNFGVSNSLNVSVVPALAKMSSKKAKQVVAHIEKLAAGGEVRKAPRGQKAYDRDMIRGLRGQNNSQYVVDLVNSKPVIFEEVLPDGRTLKVHNMARKADKGDVVQVKVTVDGEIVGDVRMGGKSAIDKAPKPEEKILTGNSMVIDPKFGGMHVRTADGRSIVDVVTDTIRAAGDIEPLEFFGADLQSTGAAAKGAQHQAQRLIDQAHIEVIDETMPAKTGWGYPDVDDGTVVSPHKLLPDSDIYGDWDINKHIEIEFEHLMNGGTPMNGSRLMVGVAASRVVNNMAKKNGFGRWLDRHFTPINNNVILGLNNPNSMAVMVQVGSRIWGSVDDLPGLEPYVGRIMKFYSEQEALMVQSRTIGAKAAVIAREVDELDAELAGQTSGTALGRLANIERSKIESQSVKEKPQPKKPGRERGHVESTPPDEFAGFLDDTDLERQRLEGELDPEVTRSHLGDPVRGTSAIDPNAPKATGTNIGGKTPVVGAEGAVRAGRQADADDIFDPADADRLPPPDADLAQPIDQLQDIDFIDGDDVLDNPEGLPLAQPLELVDDAGRAYSLSPEINRSQVLSKQVASEKAKQSALRRAINRKRDEMRKLEAEGEELAAKANTTVALVEILTTMYDDFNRKHIATNTKLVNELKEINPDFKLVDGMVPWEMLNGGGRSVNQQLEAIHTKMTGGMTAKEAAKAELGYAPPRLVKALQEGFDNILNPAEGDFFQQVMHNLDIPSVFVQPLDPLTMMLAPVAGAKTLGATIKRRTSLQVARAMDQAQQFWMLDKVLTPRTGITVSLDELMRIWHMGGKTSYFRYMEDKAMQVARNSKQAQSTGRLSTRWRNRTNALQQWPVFFRQAERSFFDVLGEGSTDSIVRHKGGRTNPANTDYYEASQRVVGQQLNERYMQKYFEGPEAFAEWFNTSPEAAKLRHLEYVDVTDGLRKIGLSADEFYSSITNSFDAYWLREVKPEKRGRAMQLWKEAAEEQAARGSTKGGPITLPDWVLDGMGEVIGARQQAPRSGLAAALRPIDWVSDYLFQRPVNYRRGFLAETVRESEWSRMKKLYASQGVRIIPDQEFIDQMRRAYPGVGEDLLQNNLPHLQQMMRKRYNVVSERHVHEMIENTVVQQMENALYAFYMESRAGRGMRAIFPFGKPWADMWGFWGREVLQRPATRGWLHAGNLDGLGAKLDNAMEYAPINPRSAAFVSRLAATDFNLENIENDPIFGGAAKALGIDGIDFSPMIFLPTEGSSFNTMIPGFGILPSLMAQVAFDWLAPDPITDPQAYRQMVAEWQRFVPGIGYNRPHGVVDQAQRAAIGGGAIGRSVQGIQDIGFLFRPDEVNHQRYISGDWKVGLTYLRSVQNQLGDAAYMGQLLEDLQDWPNDVDGETGLQSLVAEMTAGVANEVARENGWPLLAETVGEALVPARINAVDVQDESADIWIAAADIMDTIDISDYDMSTDKGKGQAASVVRTHFLREISAEERDILITENPWLAANMVSMWVKTGLGEELLGLEPYKTGGSTEDRARHQNAIEFGYIEPKSARQFLVETLAVYGQAQQRVLTSFYENSVSDFNDVLYNMLLEDEEFGPGMDMLRLAADELGMPEMPDAQLWRNQTKILDGVRLVMEREIEGEQFDTPKDREDFLDDAVRMFRLPGDLSAWGETFSGRQLNDDLEFGFALPDEFFSEDRVRMIERLGMDLQPGDEFSVLWEQVRQRQGEQFLDNPLYQSVLAESQTLPRRSGSYQAFSTAVAKVYNMPSTPPAHKIEIRRAQAYLDEAQRLRADGKLPATWVPLRDEAVETLGRLQNDDVWGKLDLKGFYDSAYGPSLGDWDWEPDEPAPLLTQEGDLNPNAQRVFIRQVIDGDTLEFWRDDSEKFFGFERQPAAFRTRLLGINAREMAAVGGEADMLRLRNKIEDAIDNNEAFYLVRDPDRYGNTDYYGRQFSWLYIGDEPYYFPETLMP